MRRRRGKAQPAGRISEWSEGDGEVLTGVPSVKNSPRAPFEPSVTLRAGMLCSGISCVRQKSWPDRSETFCSRESLARILVMRSPSTVLEELSSLSSLISFGGGGATLDFRFEALRCVLLLLEPMM